MQTKRFLLGFIAVSAMLFAACGSDEEPVAPDDALPGRVGMRLQAHLAVVNPVSAVCEEGDEELWYGPFVGDVLIC